MEDIEDIVNREIEQAELKYGKGWRLEYFKIFYTHLPNTDEKDNGFLRNMLILTGVWETPYEQIVTDKEKEKHSEIYLKLTPKYFHEVIDRLLGVYDISTAEIAELLKDRGTKKFFENDYDTLCDKVFPVYLVLRNMGYTHKDLTG